MKNKNRSTVNKLLSYIRPYSFLFIISLILTVLSVVCSLFVPVMSGKAIDHIIDKGIVEFGPVFDILIKMGIIIVTGAICQWFIGYINNMITFRIIKDLREQIFKKIEELPLSYLDSKQSGEMVSRCVTDIEQISDGLLMGFSQVFNGVLTIICTIIFMLRINPLITAIVVVLSPLSFMLTKFIASKTHRMFMLQSISRGNLTAFTDEALENMKLVISFDHMEEGKKEFDEKNRILSEYSLKSTFFSSLVNPSTRLIYSVLYALITISGSFIVISGGMTVGSLSAFLGYTNQYSKPFNEITGTITEFQNALASAARVFEVIDTPSAEPLSDEKTVHGEISTGSVSIEHVSFSYNKEVPLITDFNLEVKPGQRVAIVGPTGCGKTTLINLLMRFYDVDSGAIKIDGKDIRDMSYEEMRSHYGMVLQDIWLKNATIKENIAYGRPEASMDEIIEAAKNAYAHEFIEKMPNGYDTIIGEDGGSLSQGQKQLLCIARVMLDDPPMLILDEATSSVDSMTEIRITKAFERLMAGHTSFIVAHRLSTIINSDLILVMNSGKVVEQGTHEELLEKKGFYYDLYQSQFAH
ncbi:MAG: ABC transporter ATP-binding protein [Candidatus Alectryocaccobium sp.]|jgi:ATP-binding cassette subfamily B multidrug efflux pump|nr:ABC transporter ATP-binding protein [Candidatus Alectryocaccobium sp.]